jgi:hypothetical protein
MARPRNRIRGFQFPAISSLAVVFGSAVIALAVLSVMSGPFLDNEKKSQQSSIQPVKQAFLESIVAQSGVNETTRALQALDDVPVSPLFCTSIFSFSQNLLFFVGFCEYLLGHLVFMCFF